MLGIIYTYTISYPCLNLRIYMFCIPFQEIAFLIMYENVKILSYFLSHVALIEKALSYLSSHFLH